MGGHMPRVVIEYDSPKEDEFLEGALLGRETLRVLKGLRRWMERESRGRPEAGKTYREGIVDCLEKLNELEGQGDEDGGEDDAGDQERPDHDDDR